MPIVCARQADQPAPLLEQAGSLLRNALDAMDAGDLEVKAAKLRTTPGKLRDLVATSSAVTFDPNAGTLHYRCNFGGRTAPEGLVFPQRPESAALTAQALLEPAADDPDTSQAFLLHSRPSAPRTLFLDFDGHTTTGTLWNRAPCYETTAANIAKYCYSATRSWAPSFVTPPFSLDSNAAFSTTDLQAIVRIWRAVSEDYAHFNVDVTTEAPSFSLAGGRGGHVCIGGSDLDWFAIGYTSSIAGGVSYVDVFGDGDYGAGYPSNGNEVAPSFVWVAPLGYDIKAMWEAVSHEAGHSLGLYHHGRSACAANGYQREEYYDGHANWAPIMGGSYYKDLSHWSHGEYAFATEPAQDDVATIGAYLGFASDDVGDTRAAARAMPNANTSSGEAFTGVINSRTDLDVFSFGASAGQTINVSLALTTSADTYWYGSYYRTNLDAKVTLADSAGLLLYTWDNPSDVLQGVQTAVTLPSTGTYYLTVQGTSSGADATSGYTNYGCLGLYTITAAASSGTGVPVMTPTSVTCSASLPSTIQLSPSASGACEAVVLTTSDLYSATGPDVTVTPSPPSGMRFTPGAYGFTISGTSGPSCTVSFTVVASASCSSGGGSGGGGGGGGGTSVSCPSASQVITLQPGSCDGTTLVKGSLFTGSSATITPALPADMFFPPGRPVTYRVASSDKKSRCTFRIQVKPCVPVCADPAPVLPTGKGKCLADKTSVPSTLLSYNSVGAGTTVSLSGPLGAGPRKISALVRYKGGLTARASCSVTIADQEAPAVSLLSGSGACAYPSAPGKASACFAAKELVKVTDNCRGTPPKLQLLNCTVAADGADSDCFQADGRVCVNFPPTGSRAARAVVAAVDAAGNASPQIVASITAHSAKTAGCRPK